MFHPSVRYRAIETKSVVPATRNAAVPPVAARSLRSDESPETAMTDREATPHQVMVNAAASAPAAASSQGQEFIVLTAWEEVETSAPQPSGTTTREIADYETGADAQTQSDDATSERRHISGPADFRHAPDPARGIPQTPRPALRQPRPRTRKPAHTTSSHSHRPTASAFDGGWLFFQL